MIKKRLFPNNVTLISQKIEKSGTVAVGFYFSVGSRYEKEGERGISHFCEHLLFKGTKGRTRRELVCSFDRMGGMVNAFTERDDVCVYAVVPSSKENFSLTMDILCDMSCNCVFPADEVEKERSVVENEILAVEDDPEESSLDAFAGTVWKDSGLGQTITGSVRDVENLDVKKIREWYEKYFVHGFLTVFVCGDFDEETAVMALENLPVHADRPFELDFRSVWNSGNYFEKSRFGQQQIYFSYPLDPVFDEKTYWTLAVFNALCGDSMGSRLFESLREKNGLCYSVYSFYSFYKDNGLWACYVSCEKADVEKTLVLVQQEIASLIENGLSDSEISDAKGHLCGEETMGESDMEYVMRRLQKHYFLGLPMLELDQIVASIRDVQKNDIMDLAKKILKKDSRTILVYGKKLSKKKQRKVIL